MANRVLAICGPTAIGKTAVAMALADAYPVRLISVDSAMVFRGMDIGTGKPSPSELLRYPHDLIDVAEPSEVFSVARFVEGADASVKHALAQGRLPILVGGTMMYLKAFRDGLAPLPTTDAELRRRIEARGEAEGWNALHDELGRADASAARSIHPNNHQRLVRALAVIETTGEPISALWARSRGIVDRLGVALDEIALVPVARDVLHQAIRARFDSMLSAGLVDEVSGLRQSGELNEAMPSMRSVGYRQVWQYLEGAYGYEDMVERAVAATRQLAKRQLTWLNRFPGALRVEAGPAERVAATIAQGLGLGSA